MMTDSRFALRQLRKSPGLTFLAVITLGADFKGAASHLDVVSFLFVLELGNAGIPGAV